MTTEKWNEFDEHDLVVIVCPRCQRENGGTGKVAIVTTMWKPDCDDAVMYTSSHAVDIDYRTDVASRGKDGWERALYASADGRLPMTIEPTTQVTVRCRHGARTITTEQLDQEERLARKSKHPRVLVSPPPPR